MPSSSTKFPLGVFVGGPNSVAGAGDAVVDQRYNELTQVMATRAQFMDAYIDQRKSIFEWASNASYTAWSWSQDSNARGMTPVIGMPMTSGAMGLSNDQFYKNFASGQYDDAIRGMVKSWADQGFKTQEWRPGWEMNVAGMSSYIGDDSQTQADWIKAFQHISDVLHSAGSQQGVNVQVIWNPNVQNWNTTNPLTLYPGDQYVDVIAGDLYDNAYPYSLANLGKGDGSTASSFAEWASNPANLSHYYSYPAATIWSNDGSTGHSMSLQNLIDFAKQQGKPIAIAETGAGGSGMDGMSDDGTFPQWLATTLGNSGAEVKFVNIWDLNDYGNWSFSSPGANKPNEAAAWSKYFGAGSASSNADNATITGNATQIGNSAPLYLGSSASSNAKPAATGTPTLFDLSSGSFANDVITNFDVSQDILGFSKSQIDSYQTAQHDMSSVASGTLITVDSTHSVLLQGVSSAGLRASNFSFV